MKRNGWITSVVAILASLLLHGQVAIAQTAVAQIGIAKNLQFAKLTDDQFDQFEKELNAILKTRLPEEKEFVHQVIEKLQTAKLPAKLVVSSWQWARNHRPDTKYPFVYFEHVLRLQATRIGLEDEVPPYNYGVYSKTNRPRKR